MKETKIAKENIEKLNKKALLSISGVKLESDCETHKQTCQRWLEFCDILYEESIGLVAPSIVEGKITDLKQAIKLYEENGI